MSHPISVNGTTIQTTVTYDAEVVTQWVDRITDLYCQSAVPVGLNTERQPNLNTSRLNPVATLTLCTGLDCLVLQLHYLDGIPGSLRRFLANRNANFFVLSSDELDMLHEEYGLTCHNYLSLSDITAKLWQLEPDRPRLPFLASVICDLQIRNDTPSGDWDSRHLSESQIAYACTNAYCCYKLGHKIYFELD